MTTIDVNIISNNGNSNIINISKGSIQIGNTIITVDSKDMFCKQIVEECYSTHDNLTSKEQEWGIINTCQYLLTDSEIEGQWPKLVLFILHTCKLTKTGKYSFIYNFELDNSIKQRNINKLYQLLNLSQEDRWKEKINNDLLSANEKNKLSIIRNKEMTAILNLVSEGRTMEFPYLSGFMTPCNNNLNTTLFSDCYKGICIEEIHEHVDTEPTVLMIPFNKKSLNGNIIKEIRCYDFDILMEALSSDNVSDPFTNEIFTPELERMLKNRYDIEIKLYKAFLRYLDIQ